MYRNVHKTEWSVENIQVMIKYVTLQCIFTKKKIMFDFMKSNHIEYYTENIWHLNSVQLRKCSAKHFNSIVHILLLL